MLTTQKRKRRIIRFKKPKILKKERIQIISRFEENLENLRTDCISLFTKKQLANDLRFLRKIAISIKQAYYEARLAKIQHRFASTAERVRHFLSTPIGAPFVSKTTLLKAAFHFSEQDPQHSDLSQILTDFAKYGPKYSEQILRAFSIRESYIPPGQKM